MSTKENPAPRANAESRAEPIDHSTRKGITTEGARPDFAAGYIATRYGLSAGWAALVARLAEIGGALA